MRAGWLAAAAGLVLGASPAAAARYYEFQVTGSANRPDVYNVLANRPGEFILGIYTLTYTSIDTFAFDTASLPAVPDTSQPGWNGIAYPYHFSSSGSTSGQAYALPANYTVNLESASTSSRAYVQSYTLPGGPAFSFAFAFSDVAAGDALRPLPIGGGSFAYDPIFDERGPYTYPTEPGQIISVLARTTDVVPASLKATEQLFVSILPEPASWATIIAGVGLAGAVLRRKRHRARRVGGTLAIA